MTDLIIKKCTVSDIENAPNIEVLLREYGEESALSGLRPHANMELYHTIERTNGFHLFGAYIGKPLIGFITIIATVLPHYGVCVAVAESYFVAKKHRLTGAGLQLLLAGERCAQEEGSPGLLVSAVLGSKLAEALPGVGYTETNRVFFKRLANA